MEPEIGYCTVQAGADTFVSDKIARVLDRYIDSEDAVLNTCAGETTIQADEIRNDIDESKPADYHVDCRDIGSEVEQSVDAVLHDPPFSRHQAVRTWGLKPEQWPGYQAVHREVHPLLKDGGYLIQAGFSAVPVASGLRDDYEREAIVVCNQLGRQDDWILTVDQKTAQSTSTRPWGTTASVVPNGEIGADGEFGVTYKSVPGKVSPADIWAAAKDRCNGTTLVLDWQGNIDASRVGVSGPIERYHSTAQLDRYISMQEDGSPVPPAELGDVLPGRQPDTVVIWPHKTASNITTEYDGYEIGFIRAIKQEIDRHFGSGVEVLLIGNTATGMRRQWDYTHTGVTVVDGENPDSAWYVSQFAKGQNGLGEAAEPMLLTPDGWTPDRRESPADNRHCSDPEAGRWVVDEPRVTLERHPALYYHCPACGASGGSGCIDSDNDDWTQLNYGAVHTDRREYALEQIQRDGSVRVYDGGRYLGTVERTHSDDVSTPSKATLPAADTEPSKAQEKGTQATLGDALP